MPTFKHNGAKSISIKNHIANYTENNLGMPPWQRKGQKVWEGDYKSELIESIMSGIMIPILYLGRIVGKHHPYIIDGGHRTRALAAYTNNMYAWERGTERVYYSEVPKVTRGNRVMTDVERAEFDTYKLTIVTYVDITENQARIIFNRLQNAAPMAMADVINSYESPLVEFFRGTVRPKLLNGNESYKHLKGISLKHPDTNEDIYQFLSWFTIINPDESMDDPKKNALKHIEMGKGRNNNMCFKFLRDFDSRDLTTEMKHSFNAKIDALIQFVSRDPGLFASGSKSDFPTYLYSSLYVNDFSPDKYLKLLKDVKLYKSYDGEMHNFSKQGDFETAESKKLSRDKLNAEYEGMLFDWVKSRQQNPSSEKNMLSRNAIVEHWCIDNERRIEDNFIEGDILEEVQ